MKLSDRHWFWILSGALMLILGFQAARFPTLEGDALEIVAAVETFGVIHSPGFPVYMILVHLFRGLLFFLTTAHAISLFSVFCAAASSSVMFWLLRSRRVERWCAIVFSLMPVFALEVWYQSLIAEVYSLAVLWMLLICQAFFLVEQKDSPLRLGWLVFLLVAGFATHLYVWPLIPVGFVLLIWQWRKKRWNVSVKIVALAMVLGCLPLLQLPLMAGQSRYVNEGNVNSWSRFVDHVTWKLHRERLADYEEKRQQDSGKWFEVKGQQLAFFARDVSAQFFLPLLVLMVVLTLLILIPWPGSLLQRGPPTLQHHLLFVFSGALFLNIWLVFAGSDFQPSVLSEMKVHFVPAYYFFSLWLAMGLQLFRSLRLKQVMVAVTGLILTAHVAFNYQALTLRNNDIAMVHGRELLQHLPKGALLFSQGDVDLMAITYQQAVEKFRTDVQMVNLVNGTRWYFENLQAHIDGPAWPSFYSKYFQIEAIEQNFGKVPIYFSNYYAALLVLQQPTIKGRFLVIPEKGGYRLTVEKQMIQNAVDTELVRFSNFAPGKKHSYLLRDVEKDIAGQYMDYYSRRAELLSVFEKTSDAELEWNLGSQQPVFDSRFNQLIKDQLLKVQQRFNIRNQSF